MGHKRAEAEATPMSHIEKLIIRINPAFILQMQSGTSPAPVPQIVLTECNSLPTSPSEDSAEARPSTEQQDSDGTQPTKDNNSDIKVSYFSHIVRTPSLLLWKQDLATSQNVSHTQDLDVAQRESQTRQAPVGDVTQSWPPLTRERAIKQPLKREPRVQDSLEAERQTRDEQMRDQRPETLSQKSETTSTVLRENGPSETSRVGVIRTQGVGGEKEDICHSTYRRLDSLEETIRELELSLMEFSADPDTGDIMPTAAQTRGPPAVNSSNKTQHTTENSGEGGEINRPPVPPKPSHIRTPTVKVQSNRQSLLLKLFLFLFSVEGLWSLPLGVSTRKSVYAVFADALMNCLPPVSCCL